MDNSTWICLVAGVLSALFLLAQRFLGPARDPQEPYFIPSKLPFIGHLVHLMREGAWYFGTLDKKYHHGLYTLPMLNGKMYIAASPSVSHAVNKNPKTIAFNSLVIPFMEKLFLIEKASIEIMRVNPDGLEGNHGFIMELHNCMVNALAPGPRLGDLNSGLQRSLLPRVAKLSNSDAPQKIQLWAWLRHEFSLASAEALYGPQHPFLIDESLEDDFWEFEKGMTGLLFAPLPWLTARPAFLARKRLLDALDKFTAQALSEGEKDASDFIQSRNRLSRKYGLSETTIGYGELSLIFAALVNTTPAAFWLTIYIFASPALLAEIRTEIDTCCTASLDNKTRTINTTKLRTACPLFLSMTREVLRITAPVHVSRMVLEDTLIPNVETGGNYLLKKDCVVQVATSVIHTQEQTWGADAQDFNPRRFLPPPATDPEKTTGDISRPVLPPKFDRAAFRSFGSGLHLCPGRHFAQVEIMSMAALLIVGYEIRDKSGSSIKVPPFEKAPAMAATVKPLHDLETYVTRRPEFGDIHWDMVL